MVRFSPLALKDPEGPRGEWRTPPDLFQALVQRFGPFDLDGAATQENRLCSRYLSRADGFAPWPTARRVFCNPDFSQIVPFVQLGAEAIRRLKVELVCFLLPANRTEQQWWADYAVPVLDGQRNGSVIYLAPRVAYVSPETGKPKTGVSFPSLVLVLSRWKQARRCEQWSWRQ
jgi:phage N-6-adenine-methyltransferase